ncbi:actin-related protein 4-like [Salvia hispanica]|uniref:actin-related protein 4-like n=1 Tax=Salvia hispanica TaxID=49212 RepID=UPI0020091D3E|nr:actin-related protein 4-like [Salvia hispanica]
MYGGDEVSAIVVDLGSHTCKAGYAGEDAPKAVFPSVRANSTLSLAVSKCLLIDPKEHPMLFAESCSNSQQQRENLEFVFSKVELVFCLSFNLVSLISPCLYPKLQIKPRYAFKRKEVRPGEFQVVDPSYNVYEPSISFIIFLWLDTSYSNIPMTPYELPDGQTIEIGADRFKIPDILFNPSLALTIPGMENSIETTSSAHGLPQMVIESISKCDVDIRRELYSSILLSGGTASMQQLKERLEKDLLEESPQAARVKVLASGNATERRFSVWIGGSILASLGSFQQMWFSKSEFEEHGASYIQRKCP